MPEMPGKSALGTSPRLASPTVSATTLPAAVSEVTRERNPRRFQFPSPWRLPRTRVSALSRVESVIDRRSGYAENIAQQLRGTAELEETGTVDRSYQLPPLLDTHGARLHVETCCKAECRVAHLI